MIVIKLGGSAGVDVDAVCADVAALAQDRVPLVFVHGGSHATNEVAQALGHPARFVTSPSGYESRLTDRKTLEIFEMVYCGSVNKGIVERLQRAGVDAVGLSGLDGRLWEGKRKKALRAVENGRVRVVRDTWTGTVERVRTGLLTMLLEAGCVPVLSPPGASEDGEAINVDGDRAAAATAAALGADTLLLLSNVPGVLRDKDDPSTLRSEIARDELEAVRDEVGGRMKIKLLGAAEALAGGVKRVVIGDSRGEAPVRRALDGKGTVIA